MLCTTWSSARERERERELPFPFLHINQYQTPDHLSDWNNFLKTTSSRWLPIFWQIRYNSFSSNLMSTYPVILPAPQRQHLPAKLASHYKFLISNLISKCSKLPLNLPHLSRFPFLALWTFGTLFLEEEQCQYITHPVHNHFDFLGEQLWVYILRKYRNPVWEFGLNVFENVVRLIDWRYIFKDKNGKFLKWVVLWCLSRAVRRNFSDELEWDSFFFLEKRIRAFLAYGEGVALISLSISITILFLVCWQVINVRGDPLSTSLLTVRLSVAR